MSEVVYALCAIISVGCAVQLFRSYRKRPARLSLWVMLCFISVAVNNVMLFLDRVLVPEVDLGLFRAGTAVVAAVILTGGLIWESK